MQTQTQKSPRTFAKEVRISARITSQKGTGRSMLSVAVLLSDLQNIKRSLRLSLSKGMAMRAKATAQLNPATILPVVVSPWLSASHLKPKNQQRMVHSAARPASW